MKEILREIYLPVIYILLGYLIYRLLKFVINIILTRKQKSFDETSYNYKRIQTIKNLLINIARCISLLFIILSILPVFGVDVTSILAGLGLVSAVLALAFQDTIKDLIGGVTIIVEGQFSLGDIIEVGGFKGEVIYMGLKSTRIRKYTGEVKIMANRNIVDVINYSSSYSLAIVDVSVSYEDKIEKVEKVLKDLASTLSKELTDLKEEIQVLGIQSLDSSSIIFRLTVQTEALENFKIEREIKRAIKLTFDKEKIKIPYTQIEVHNGK